MCVCFPTYCLSIFMKTIKIIIGLSLSWSQGMIIPGTNYCGSGELESKDEDPLYPETDNCCQKHDYCPEKIARFSRKFELTNFYPYTISSCECDADFRQCLKNDGSWMSTKVGQMYFNVLNLPCFELNMGKICTQETFWGKCIEEIEGQIAEFKEPQEF